MEDPVLIQLFRRWKRSGIHVAAAVSPDEPVNSFKPIQNARLLFA